MFVLSSKTYEFFKNLVQLILPGVGTLYFTVAEIWDLPASEKVVATLAAIATFLGVILKISSTTYEKLENWSDGDMVWTEDEDGASKLSFALDTPPNVLAEKDRVTFKKVVRRERPLVADDIS